MSDFEETYGSSVNARMAAHVGEGPDEPVDDLARSAPQGDPPVPGAQWDELHRRWEHWDEASQAWVIVGDPGDGIAPEDENQMAPTLARDLLHADEMEFQHMHVDDVARAPSPPKARPARSGTRSPTAGSDGTRRPASGWRPTPTHPPAEPSGQALVPQAATAWRAPGVRSPGSAVPLAASATPRTQVSQLRTIGMSTRW